MRTITWVSRGVTAVVLFALGPSRADQPKPRAAQSESAKASDDDFVVRALGINQTEIMLGRMAVKRGTTSEVRAMGEKMVQRHTELARQLRELARIDATSNPAPLSPTQQRTVARLATISEHEFNDAFKSTVNEGHVEELAMYRTAATHSADSALRTLAAGRVKALEESLASARPAPAASPESQDW